ncbi:extracellular solute-binding protein [Microbacterium pseudoresistens]|uniref:Raffinose/stachyose/melibiose transport system substrate-binding protein n=1 Tax=Microbacterium pseudoresistens TaxID=640634 RepID=A0A7Y9EVN0_9MICO|nr:extracellular solute-binding protein [Microbacterium pseudoresistens]NYD54808.1 raffinose/stachyose/melibiose transport system substrate-binding protein [Microbacterium pseudoresistens]
MNATRPRHVPRRLAVGAALVAGSLAVSLTACSPGGDTDGSTTVTIWSWRTEDQAAMDRIFDSFENEHPEITVDFQTIPDAEYQNRVSTALQGGQGPDIVQLKAYGELQPLIDAALIEPLDELVPELDSLPDTTKAGLRGIEDGNLYGVPYSIVNTGVFYNKEIFTANALEVPQTYDELIAASQTLLDAGVIPIAAGGANGTSWALEMALAAVAPSQIGPEFYDEAMAGKVDFTDPRYVAALQRMVDMLPYYSPGFQGVDYTTATQQFIGGDAAMFIGGSYENGSFASQNPDLDFGFFPYPVDDPADTAYTSSFVDGSYGLPVDAEHRDAAIEVLNFMATAEFAQMFMDELGWPPARDDVEPKNPVLLDMMAAMKNQTPYLTHVGFKWQSPTASSVLQPAFVDMIMGKVAPQSVAEQMTEAVQEWFTPNVY